MCSCILVYIKSNNKCYKLYLWDNFYFSYNVSMNIFFKYDCDLVIMCKD